MTRKMSQTDLFEGARLRDTGATRVVERLTPGEREQIIAVALTQAGPFAADEVRAGLSDGLLEKLDAFPNAMGAIFLRLSKAGCIEPTGVLGHAQRPERHRSRVMYWRIRHAQH